MFTGLDREALQNASEVNVIGCPFRDCYGGIVTFYHSPESNCKAMCGQLFKEDYIENNCPCFNLGKPVAKKTFWNEFDSWLLKGGSDGQGEKDNSGDH